MVLRFVILIGVTNLFADLTYEGGRSITGPFLAQLGAGAALISIVSGTSEFLGYALRAVSGYVADRTGRRWTLVFVGYAINMLAVPALALAGGWPAAATLMAAERTGRAIRRPVVQAMLSHAHTDVGGGRAFGINESLDAAGATLGPLVIAAVIAAGGGYRHGFAILLLSALACLGMLVFTERRYPNPAAFEGHDEDQGEGGTRRRPYPTSYWLYLAAAALLGFGFVDFALVAFHLQHTSVLKPALVPVAYAVAMGAGAVGNWVLGRAYDRFGLPVLLAAFAVGAAFPPMVFLAGSAWAFAGMALWGLNKGAQDTLLKPLLAPLVPANARSTAFGLFDTAFGTAWLGGSVALGLLYDRSLATLVIVSVTTQLLALPLFVLGHRARRSA